MSLIAGCLWFNQAKPFDYVEEKVRLYHVLPGDAPDHYVNTVSVTVSGCLILKLTKDYPIKNTITVGEDGSLLGIFGFTYPEYAPNQEQLLRECVQESPAVLERLQGEYIAVFLDGRSRTMHIVNDRFGSRPLFTFKSGDGIYFSSNMNFLRHFAGKGVDPDILGWLEIFAFDMTLGARTNQNDIMRMIPATHLTLSDHGIQEKQYWQCRFQPDPSIEPVSFSGQVWRAFCAGAEKRKSLAPKGVIALSGGLDSRMLAGALKGTNSYSAFTFVDSMDRADTLEVKVARQVSGILGLKHRVSELPETHVSSVGPAATRLTAGLVPLTHNAKTMAYISEMTREGLGFLLGGAPGNNLSGGSIPCLDYLDGSKTRACLEDIYGRHVLGGKNARSVLGKVFKSDVLDDLLPQVKSAFLGTLEGIDGPTPAHRVCAWEQAVGFPAFSANSPIHNHPEVAEAFCHLDYDYCDLMLKLPAERLYKRSFYKSLIFESIPELREVVYANTGKLVSDQPERDSPRDRKPGGFFGKVARGVKLRIRPEARSQSAPPFQYLMLQRDKRLLMEVRELVHHLPELRAMLDIDKCKGALDRLQDGRMMTRSYKHDARLMGALATMCLTLNHV